jgi:hypothetical protein
MASRLIMPTVDFVRIALGDESDSSNLSLEVGQLLLDHFRLAGDLPDFVVSQDRSRDAGYFQFGSEAICYGNCSSGAPVKTPTQPLHDAGKHVDINHSSVRLPFDPAQVVDNLRREQYRTAPAATLSWLRQMYYLIRPVLWPPMRRRLQRLYFQGWERVAFPKWPVDQTVDTILEELMLLAMKSQKVNRIPFIWFWPDGALSSTVLTHDVETADGLNFCQELMDLDDSFGMKSSFQVVPEARYPVHQSFLEGITSRGFELNVQDLNHDGRLFNDREQFLRRAEGINHYARKFGARGFRAAVLYRNADWCEALNFSYDMSVPNVAHLEAQHGGCCTTLPFFIGNLLELPVTTTQDYTLFHILNDYSTRLWEEQITQIRQKHGLISFIIHPDYIIDQKARSVYCELLRHLDDLRARQETWIALPGEVDDWWRLRSKLKLIQTGNSRRIEGHGSERARVAYAVVDNDKLAYELDGD